MVDTKVSFQLGNEKRFMNESECSINSREEHKGTSEICILSETCTTAPELQQNDDEEAVEVQQESPSAHSSVVTELNVSESDLLLKVDELNHAVTSAQLSFVKQFVDHNGKNITRIAVVTPNLRGESPITLACTLGLLNVLEFFAEQNLLFNIADKEGFYPIHRATYNGHVGVVKYLVGQFGEEGLSKETSSGFSALHIAASVGNGDIVRLLAERVTDLDQKCQEGWTALHIGVQGGSLQVVQILLEYGATVDLVNNEHNTALYIAVEHNHNEVAEELIRAGASCNHQNDNSVSPIYMAIQGKNHVIAKMLLESQADVNIQDKLGWSPLHKATHMNDEELVFMLLDHDASTNIQNTKGVTSLHLAVTNGSTMCAQLLLLQGGNCNLIDNYGISPFHAAVKSAHLQLVNIMIRHGADVNSYNNEKSTALYVACHRSDIDMIGTLLCAGASVNKGREDGWSPLHVAVQNDVEEAIGMLMYANADPNKSDKLGLTPLAMAARKKSMNIMKRIVVSPKCSTPEAIFRVAKLGDPALLEKLRSSNISLMKEDSRGTTSVHMAASSGSVEALDALLASNCKVNIQDKEGNTPLHLACAQGHTRIVHALINMDAQLNIPNRHGERCIQLAASRGHTEVINVLVSKPVVLNVKDNSGVTPLMAAIRAKHTQTAEKLLKCGAKVTIPTHSDIYPIHAAAEAGLTQLFQLLVSRGADVNKKGTFDNTCLHLSAREGHLGSVLELILNFGAEVNAENILGKKALHFAADQGHMGIVQALLEAGTKVRLLGDDNTPLYELARHRDIWDILKSWMSTKCRNGSKPFFKSSQIQTLSGVNRTPSPCYTMPDQNVVSLMWTLGTGGSVGGVGHSSRSRTPSSPTVTSAETSASQCLQLSRSNTCGGARPRTTGSRLTPGYHRQQNNSRNIPSPHSASSMNPTTSVSEPPPYNCKLVRSRSLGRSPNRSGGNETSSNMSTSMTSPSQSSSHRSRPRRLLPDTPSFFGSLLHTGAAVSPHRSHSPSPQRQSVMDDEDSQQQRRGSAASISPSRNHQVARATLSAPGSVSPHQALSPVSSANQSLAACIQNTFGNNNNRRSHSSHHPPSEAAMITTLSQVRISPNSPPSSQQHIQQSTPPPIIQNSGNSAQMEIPEIRPEIRRSSHPGVLTLYFDSNTSSPVTTSPTSRSANPSPGYLNCGTPVMSPRQANLSPSRIPAQHASQSVPSIHGGGAARSHGQTQDAFTFGKETTC